MAHGSNIHSVERPRESDVLIQANGVTLPGALAMTASAVGLVLFAHGSGSGRDSPRNRLVASELRREGFATLLFDLLSEREAEDRRHVFDIPLLADRLLAATRWAAADPLTRELPMGFFGASTGAAAALVAAAREPDVRAVVSRGGRPDLADAALAEVSAPTLLIVGGEDSQVLELNRKALAALRCHKELAVIPGATHLFEEPGTLEEAARLATKWFLHYLQ
jgi:putative phosphoribosyl transferase